MKKDSLFVSGDLELNDSTKKTTIVCDLIVTVTRSTRNVILIHYAPVLL